MGRDFEISSYFPHIVLTDREVRRFFRDLAEAGLGVGAVGRERYPVLEHLVRARDGGARIQDADAEELLRARGGNLPRGHGIVPLLGQVAGLTRPAAAWLRFEPTSPRYPELDGLHLRVDDAALRLPPAAPSDAVGPGWQALLTWYGALCTSLRVAYGYGDWEDLFLQSVIPPSRADVLAGSVGTLFRLNCLGPGLVSRLGAGRVMATPAQVVIRLRYGGVLVGVKLYYAEGSARGFRAVADHLGIPQGSGAIGAATADATTPATADDPTDRP